MLRRVGCLLSIAALSAVAITTPAAARRQPSGGQPQPSGSARVTGRVVAADTGTPVRLAKVSLDSQRTEGPNRPYVHVSRQIETDVNGRFDFADLPAGSYNLAVNPMSGFVPLQRSKEATVATGRTVEVTVRLDRSGAIEGRIQDENADGMLAAEVHAVRRVTFGSHTTLAASGVSATTNDLGEFRLFNLPAGEYYVLATYSRPRHDGDPVPKAGYANTYYPGSPALRGARAVVVRAGRDSEGVNFTLARCRLARLSITAVNSRGVPLGRDVQMALTRRDDVYLRSSSRYTSWREDGAFRFDAIQPGDYYLVVTPGERMKEGAYVNVSIGEADVSLRVRTNTGVKVSGRVVVDGRPAATGGSADFWISWYSAAGDARPLLSAGAVGSGAGKRPLRVGLFSRTDGALRGRCRSPSVDSPSRGGARREDPAVCRDGTFRRRRRRAHETGGACGRERYECERKGRARTRHGDPLPGGSDAVASSLHQVRQNERLTRVCRRNTPACQDADDTTASRTVLHSGNPRRWPRRSGGGGRARCTSPARGAGHACRG